MPLPGKKPDASQVEHSPKTNWLAMVMQNWNDKHNTALKMVLIAAILGGITLSIKSAITKWDPYNASYQALEAQNAKRLAEYTQGLATLKDEHSKEVEAIHQGFQAQVDEIMEASQERLDQQSQGFQQQLEQLQAEQHQQLEAFQQQLEQLRSTVAEIAQKANREEGDLASRLEQWQQTMGSLQTMLREIEQQAGDQNSTFQQLSQRLASLDQQMQSAIKGSMNDEAMGLLRQMVADRLEPLIQEMQPIVQARLASNIEVIVPDIATPESTEGMGIINAMVGPTMRLYNQAAKMLASRGETTEANIVQDMRSHFGDASFRGDYPDPESPGDKKVVVISAIDWKFDNSNNLQTTLRLELPFQLDQVAKIALERHFAGKLKYDANGHVLLNMTIRKPKKPKAEDVSVLSEIANVYQAQQELHKTQPENTAYVGEDLNAAYYRELPALLGALEEDAAFSTPVERYTAYAPKTSSLAINKRKQRLHQPVLLGPSKLTIAKIMDRLDGRNGFSLEGINFKVRGWKGVEPIPSPNMLVNQNNGVFSLRFLGKGSWNKRYLNDLREAAEVAFGDFYIELINETSGTYLFTPKGLEAFSSPASAELRPVDIRNVIAVRLSGKKMSNNQVIITLKHKNTGVKTYHTVKVHDDFSLEIVASDLSDFPEAQNNPSRQQKMFDDVFAAIREAMGA